MLASVWLLGRIGERWERGESVWCPEMGICKAILGG